MIDLFRKVLSSNNRVYWFSERPSLLTHGFISQPQLIEDIVGLRS